MDGYIIWVICPVTHLSVRETRLLTFPACSHYRNLASRLLDCAKQAYDVEAMYDASGCYRYNKYGTNWRAVIAWFVAWIPLTPGFARGVCFDWHAGIVVKS
jgi:hypothetical protein